MSCPQGVTFDGTNDFLFRGALAGLTDGRQGAISFWLRLNGGDGANQFFLGCSSQRIEVARRSDNTLRFQLLTSGGSTLLRANTTAATLTAGANWHHVAMSWDTNFAAGLKLAHIAIDDADVAVTKTDAGAAADIPYAGVGEWSVCADQGSSGTDKLNGDLADFWFTDEYIDFSVEANRRKFIGATGGAVDLGASGELPTGTAAKVYQRGPAANFPANLGSGGDFTVSGELTDAADDPPCFIPPFPVVLLPGSLM